MKFKYLKGLKITGMAINDSCYVIEINNKYELHISAPHAIVDVDLWDKNTKKYYDENIWSELQDYKGKIF
jgi:hypothetical protein